MRPIILTFQAFMSYRDETTIDFRKFGNDLFLISGQTGSGKTTIFEAISYALYGEPSGFRKEKDLRSDFADPSKETFVSLTFEIGEKTYNIRRTPSQSLNKIKGEGQTIKNSTAVLTLPDGRVIVRLSDVDKKLEEIIGLDQTQFNQTVMIPQNDFMKLLNAQTKERQQIYEKIFNTENCRYFIERLKTQNDEAYEKLKGSDSNIKLHLSSFRMEKEATEYKEFETALDNLTTGLDSLNTIVGLITKYQSEQQTKLLMLKKMQSDQEKVLNGIVVRKQAAIDTNTNVFKYQEAHRKLEELKLKHEEMMKTSHLLNQISKAIACQVSENEYLNAKKLKEDNIKEIEQRKNKLLLLKAVLDKKAALLEETEKQKPIKEGLLSEKTLIDDSLVKYETLDETNKKLANDNAAFAELTVKQSLLNEAQIKLGADIENEKSIIENSKVSDSSLNLLRSKMAAADDQIGKAGKLLNDLLAYDNGTKEVENLRPQAVILQNIYKKTAAEYADIFSNYCANIAGILSEELKDNKPCPVCGSLLHPHKAVLTSKEISKTAVDKAKKAEDQASKDLSDQTKHISMLDERNKTLEKGLVSNAVSLLEIKNNSISTADIKSLTNSFLSEKKEEKNELAKQLVLNEKEFIAVSDLKNKEKKDETNYTSNDETIKELSKKVVEASIEIGKMKITEEALKASLKYDNKADANKRISQIVFRLKMIDDDIQKALDENKAAEANLLSNQDAINAAISKKDTLANTSDNYFDKFSKQLKEDGFADENDYHQHLDQRSSIDKLTKELQDYNNQTSSYKGIIDSFDEYIEKQPVDIDEIDKELETKKNDKKTIDDQYMKLSSDYSANNVIIQEVEEIRSRRKTLEDESGTLDLLYKTASGQLNQKDKIDFETYIQTVYFNQILDKANIRFQEMTSKRYILLRNKMERISKDTALDIDIMDNYTGKERRAASLSGGETFMATLSLALGLSDVILEMNGGIRLDSMFIDEGFGTLDEESLNNALLVLERLSNGERMVGIISHVEDLEQIITKQIKVTKAENGSKLEIVA